MVATGFDNRERRKSPSLAGDMEVAPQSSWNMNTKRDEIRTRPAPQRSEEGASPFERRRISEPTEEPSVFTRPMRAAAPVVEEENEERPPVRRREEKKEEEKDDDLGIPAFIRRKMM